MPIEGMPAEGHEEGVSKWKEQQNLTTLIRIETIMEALGQTPDFSDARAVLDQADALLSSNQLWATAPAEVSVAKDTDLIINLHHPELAAAASGIDEVRELLRKCLEDCRS